MANTYTQIHTQFVFAVKHRAALMERDWQGSLHRYVTGIIQANDDKLLQVNSAHDPITHPYTHHSPQQFIPYLPPSD